MQEILDTIARLIEQRTKDAEEASATEARAATIAEVLAVVDFDKLDKTAQSIEDQSSRLKMLVEIKQARSRLAALSPAPLVCSWCGQPDEHHIVTCPVVVDLKPTPSES